MKYEKSMGEGRTIQVLIETLGEDYDRCYRETLKSFDEETIDANGNLDADYKFHARQLTNVLMAVRYAVLDAQRNYR